MLTTSLDGLWVLQVLSGVEVLAPELGLRPHLPSAESAAGALAHPMAGELHAAGVIDSDGRVDQTVLEWLTVVSLRDAGLVLHARTPAGGASPDRALLARFAQWWVCIERYGDAIRLSGVGTATSEHSAGRLIRGQIERFLGQLTPATVKPVTIDAGNLLAAVADRTSLGRFLADKGFDRDQVDILMLAADPERSAQASLVAIESGAGDGFRSHIESGIVTIIDTPRGRLLSEHVRRDGRSWMIVGPGSAVNIASAVMAMMRRLPAQDDWHSRRKAV